MNDLTGHPPRRPAARTAAMVGIAAVVVSLSSGVLLHVVAAGQVSPFGDTVSSYVHAEGGAGLLAVGTLSLAAGFAAVAYGLVATGVRVDRATRTLALVWGAALVCVVFFPADMVGAPRTLRGALHNWAGGSVFVCLPAAGWRLSFVLKGDWQSTARTVRVLALGSGVAVLAFVVTHPPITRWYGGTALHGLSERILLTLQIAILLVLSNRLARYAARDLARPDRPHRLVTAAPVSSVVPVVPGQLAPGAHPPDRNHKPELPGRTPMPDLPGRTSVPDLAGGNRRPEVVR